MFCRQQVETIPERYLNIEEKKTEPYLVVEKASSPPGWMFGPVKTMRLINPMDQDISLLDVGDHRHDGREISYSVDILEFRNTLAGQWERHEKRRMRRCGNCLCTAVRVIGPGQSIKLPCYVGAETRTPETPPPHRAYRVGRSYVVGQGVRPDKVAKHGAMSREMIDQPNYYGIDGIDHNFSGSVRGIAWSPEYRIPST